MADDSTIIPFARTTLPATPEDAAVAAPSAAGLEAAANLREHLGALAKIADEGLCHVGAEMSALEDQLPTIWRVMARRALETLAEVDGPDHAARYAQFVAEMLVLPSRPAA